MSANPENFAGGKYFSRSGHPKRLHRAHIWVKGVEVFVEYELDGQYMAATSTDPAEYPYAIVKSIECAKHTDILPLLEAGVSVEDVADSLERTWRE